MLTNRRKDRGSNVKLSFCKIRAKKTHKTRFSHLYAWRQYVLHPFYVHPGDRNPLY